MIKMMITDIVYSYCGWLRNPFPSCTGKGMVETSKPFFYRSGMFTTFYNQLLDVATIHPMDPMVSRQGAMGAFMSPPMGQMPFEMPMQMYPPAFMGGRWPPVKGSFFRKKLPSKSSDLQENA